ncbi:unnamed protein product [Spirodela intermedia]|uniref:Uncharacterized protein n=1 Tax=Spirodela intermedia TaxID=51605 RepID=A0A7I8JSI6_SPIIN|nr:unnamed protein product [Spirodela intermedia]CAA6673167.1 unnamed protein product [Spirodela intermedia]
MLIEKIDVYSFGVVLLKLIIGKPPIFRGLGNISTISWVQSRIQRRNTTKRVDKRLEEKFDTNSIWKVVEVVLSCPSLNSTQRPSISDVVVQLKVCLTYVTSQETSSNFQNREKSVDAMVPFFPNIDTSLGQDNVMQ